MKNKGKEQHHDKEASAFTNNKPSRHAPVISNKRQRKINCDEIQSNGKGLDLSLFEGQVPMEIICALCRRVLVQPEVSSCQHVFCANCLRCHIDLDCPTCRERLQMTTQQPPTQLCLKLLNQRIHCETKCGQVMLLGQLPQHIKDECPNAPVPCLYAKKGCRMKVKRCEQEDHAKECDFRPVQCEACGEKTTYKDIVRHQKRNLCVENRIKNQLLLAVRSTRKEEKNHKKSLEKQRVHMDIHQRRTEIEHTRRLTTARVQRQVQQNYHLQRSRSNSQLFFRSTSPQKADQRDVIISQRNGSDVNGNEGVFCDDEGPSLVNKNEQPHNLQDNVPETGNNTDDPSNVFVTHLAESENGHDDPSNVFVTHLAESEDGHGTSIISGMSKENTQILTCKKCFKPFKSLRNKANSCRWHAGPIVEIFGGSCYTCGRLDYQIGCVVGFHEA